jgi:hypothetical protein
MPARLLLEHRYSATYCSVCKAPSTTVPATFEAAILFQWRLVRAVEAPVRATADHCVVSEGWSPDAAGDERILRVEQIVGE